MSDDEDKKLEALNQNFNNKLAIWGTVAFVFLGLWFYCFYALAYIGLNFLPYILIYAGCVGALFFAFKKFKVLSIIGLIFLLGATMLVSSIKVNWKKDYYESEIPFLLSDHIDNVPAWEAHLLSPIIGVPDWFRFNKECAEPVMSRQEIRNECKTLTGIHDRYNLDMKTELDEYLARMRHTASLIQKRGSLTAPQYKGCIQKKECAQIPTLPEGIDEENINPEDQDHMRISQVFWDLVEAKPLTADICSFSILCQVLHRSGAINFDQKS